MLNDIAHAVRRLARSPGFTAAALLTLALGIGVNATTFTVVNALALKAPPFADDGRLVMVYYSNPQAQSWPNTPGNFQDLRQRSTVFESLAAFSSETPNLGEPGQPAERLTGMRVSADFLPMLGVAPAMGRFFTKEEDQGRHGGVAIVTNGFWRRRLAGDPGAIGRTLRLDGSPVTVVGVMPPSFDDPLVMGRVEIWRPLALSPQDWSVRNSAWLFALGRLKPGVTVGQAQAQMDAIAASLAREYPDSNAQSGLRVVPQEQTRIEPSSRRMSWLTMGLTLFVLLIACVNLANLQLARSASQAREHAIRLALGSSRGSLIRRLLTESLLLSLAGGALGLLVAQWGNSLVGRHIDIGRVQGLELPLNLRIIAFTFAVSAATGALFGIAPAWIAARTDASAALRQGGRGMTGGRAQHRLRHALIVTELALALALLAGAGFFVTGTRRLMRMDLGWRPERLLNGTLSLPYNRYEGDDQIRAFTGRLRQSLAALPGVDSAALSADPPSWGFNGASDFAVEGLRPPLRVNEEMMYLNSVTPGFFGTMGIRLVRGRDFTDGDRPDSPRVVIVNEAMAMRFWPGEDPVGKRIGSTDPASPGWMEVVGVVNDIRNPGNLVRPVSRFQTYRPMTQAPGHWFSFTLHSASDPHLLEGPARRAVAAIDPDLAVFRLETAEEDLRVITGNYTLAGWALTEMALLGLLLAAVGIYGVIANIAVQRTQEIGIRMALGAQARDVLWLFLRNGMRLAAMGTAAGVLLAAALTRALAAAMPEVPGQSPATVAAVAALLALVAVLACWLPARRATRVDPIVALRAE